MGPLQNQEHEESSQVSQQNPAGRNEILMKLELLKKIDLFDCFPLETLESLAQNITIT